MPQRTGYRPFKDIKNLYRGEVLEKKKKYLSADPEEDLRFFYNAMADVREIKEFRQLPYKKPQKRFRPLKNKDSSMEILKDIVSGSLKIDISKTQEYVQWKAPARTEATTEALHRGYFSVQDTIDLHGYTVAESKTLLEDFFKRALLRGYRCVKIIHGRGLSSPKGPVLKEAVLRWLERDLRKFVQAYATASPNDGGLGATYVLLKSKN